MYIKKNKTGFTIVELLVVVVVIGILAAVTIISYSGISKKANIASIQSDLANASNKLKMYFSEHEVYPASLDASNCPLNSSAIADNNYCLGVTPGNYYTYTSASPYKTFSLTATRGSLSYNINENNNSFTQLSVSGVLSAQSPATKTIEQYSVVSIASSPDGKFIYLGDDESPSIAMYSRNTTTGAITPLSPLEVGTYGSPVDIVISPDGKSAYSVGSVSGSLAMFSRNTSTGDLTPMATPAVTVGSGPQSVVVSADGASVYVVNMSSNTVSMFSRNTTTGMLTALATPTIATGSQPIDIAISADGTSVYVANYGASTISMYSRNTTTGALTVLATPTIAAGVNITSIAISPDGKSVYATQRNANSARSILAYSRNTSTGALSAIASPALSDYGLSVIVSPDGNNVYVLNDYNTISMMSRDSSTGLVTTLGVPKVSKSDNQGVFCITPDGKNVYVSGWSGTVSIFTRSI